jgi:3-oxoacyl-[acyl-carrier protein] reductase
MRKIIVTGAARGIGYAAAMAFIKKGSFVFFNCRKVSPELEKMCNELNSKAKCSETAVFDITREDEVTSFVKTLENGTIDVLVLNAGIIRDNLLPSVSNSDWVSVMNTNFWSNVNFYKSLYENHKLSENCKIISLGSISGVRPREGQGPYAVSKSMLISWTRNMAAKNGSDIFYCVSPGPVATDLIKTAPWYNRPEAFERIPQRRFADPDEIAELITMLATENLPIASGSNIVIDGGITLTTKGA